MTRWSNPWLKKNPLLSIWLSTANAMMGAARGQAAAAVARSAGAAAPQAGIGPASVMRPQRVPKPARRAAELRRHAAAFGLRRRALRRPAAPSAGSRLVMRW